MDSHGFLRVIEEAFAPFLAGLGFVLDPPDVSGRLYDVAFVGPRHTVSISYEPGEDTFFVLIFTRKGRRLSDIDNAFKTARLGDLNKRYMHLVTADERKDAEMSLQGVIATDASERQLVKYARELLLVLPKYLKESS